MVKFTISTKYIERAKLHSLLKQISPNGYTVEEVDEKFIISAQRKLTTPGMGPKSDELRRLLGRLRQQASSQRFFIISDDLKQNVSKDLISGILHEFEHPKHHHSRLVSAISNDGFKILSILAWINQEKSILSFINHGELDTRLPMTEHQVRMIDGRIQNRFWLEVQWEYLPYHFARDDFHHQINDRMILPFVTERELAEGASGELFKNTIHASQQSFFPKSVCISSTFVDNCSESFTHRVGRRYLSYVRESNYGNLRRRRRQHLKKEKQCLELLRNLRHESIIELLGSYTHRNQHNLLFPLLPMDLAAFLNRETRYGSFQRNPTFYSALHGLASAMDTVHGLHLRAQPHQDALTRIGYHHDIRPKNILVTDSTFILADFGLARFKGADEDSKTPWKSGVGDYIAPECMDEEFNSLQVGRSMDLWSFGCLTADIATYMQRGPSGVKAFKQNRVYHDLKKNWKHSCFFQEQAPSDSVKSWLNLVDDSAQDDGLFCLTQMARTMLKVQEKDRPNAQHLCRRFCYISCKAYFRAIMELFGINLRHRFETDRHFAASSVMNLHSCVTMMKAWGKILAMGTHRITCELFEQEPKIGERLKAKLHQLYLDAQEDAAAHPRNGETSEALDQQTPILLSHHPVDEKWRESVQGLLDAVPQVYRKRMAQEWRVELLDSRSEEELRNIEDRAQHNLAPDRDIGAFATLKRLDLGFRTHVEHTSPEQRKLIMKYWQIEGRTSLDDIHEVGYLRSEERSSPPRTETWNDRERVLVEWMLYSPAWETQSDEEKVVKIASLAEKLHGRKPTGFRVLDCRGVIPPTAENAYEGFGFVYTLPPHVQASTDPMPKTLLQILQGEDRAWLLEEKFNVAKRLTSSIFELHSAGWLHKNLSSSSLMFFGERKEWSRGSSSAPYLINFNHSRPDGETWFSDADLHARTPYHHPQYICGTTRFQKVHDYYSIGVVLLEIGFWQPISAFRAQHKTESEQGFRELLIKRYAPKLGAKMGSLYREVVIACLGSKFGIVSEEPDATDDAVLFYWAVVARLDCCRLTDS